jgi:protein N-terminal methyltransferase
VGLQEFNFEHRYDVIWVQWVLCYLTDEDLIKFLVKSRENLVDQKSGMIFVKENVHDSGFYVDKDDNSVIRSDKLFQELFEQAGFTVVKHIYQPGFPKDLFRISLYALIVTQE